jgi:hypothetical protein
MVIRAECDTGVAVVAHEQGFRPSINIVEKKFDR